MYACEVCGRAAVVMTQDTREVEPTKDEQGTWWEQHVKEGPPHYFCQAHRRKPVRHPRRDPQPEAAPA
jgi:hypothetical protein